MEIEDNISYTLIESSQLLHMSLAQLQKYIQANKIEVRKTAYSDRIKGKELKKFLDKYSGLIKDEI